MTWASGGQGREEVSGLVGGDGAGSVQGGGVLAQAQQGGQVDDDVEVDVGLAVAQHEVGQRLGAGLADGLRVV
ncbi:MAG: hypothetical protein Q7V58_07405, partial [Actinomycetota bacterium]|nr:hypothetical protein [Actinomycetota bacterium]